MKTHAFDLPVKIGDATIYLDAVAHYEYEPIMPATEYDPEDGGVTLCRITVHQDGVDYNVGWLDELWVDDLIREIYDEHR